MGITWCYYRCMALVVEQQPRAFKTAWFSKSAKKAHITDTQLCSAFRGVLLGQADDLGGGVFKKRIGHNLYRAIILTRAGKLWVYEYLFAKKDRANIEDDELVQFKKLAKAYATLEPQQIDALIADGQWMEICHES